ncbi:MAG: cyclic nucleotide-binding domain-containing protein [Acidobacteriia bacterium]|nr:cyclic nucleotide-binding domain-containing protein [Terriglobia bacterium]
MIETRELQQINVFGDVEEDQLAWLIQQGEEIRAEAGEILFREGEAADHMFVILDGDFEVRDRAGGRRVFYARAGEVTGVLPFSRLRTFVGTGRAISALRLARFHRSIFPQMLQRMPALTERLVTLMLDRVRETTRMSEQREKLEALGKLSAGLAHELNNPAAAVKRAATAIWDVRKELRAAYLRLDQQSLTPEQRTYIAQCEDEALATLSKPAFATLSAVERSDREQELEEWMEAHGVGEPWKISSTLVEADMDARKLESIAEAVGCEALADVLVRLNYSFLAARMVEEIRQGATRISDLVAAVKQYTYMDQGAEQEVDIHSGIESTLTILAYKLRAKSIQVERAYSSALPKICAFGAELNQVWTNLIVNAIDAMPEGGCLQIRTFEDFNDVVVEVDDNGSGIPPEVLPHIFEPFFTTKGVGEGTGLGLDTALRVIRRHRGDIRVQSKPGATKFRVSIPKPAAVA